MDALRAALRARAKTLIRLGIGLAVLILLYQGYRMWTRPAEEAPQRPVQAGNRLQYPPGAPQLSFLRIEPVETYPVPLLEPLHGRIAYDEDATARVFAPVNGRVTKVAVQAGAVVKAGDPLLWLDSPDYAQAVADAAKADADRRAKDQALTRAKVLFEGEALAKKDLEAARSDAAQADAEAVRARARLKNLTLGVSGGGEGFALRAPLSGVVMAREASPGTQVRQDADQPLFVISDPTRLWVTAELAEKDLGKVRAGQMLTVQVDAYPGERFSAKVTAVGDVLDPATRRVPVRAVLDNASRRLKPEMYARVMPVAEGENLPRLPNTALVTEGLHAYVFVEVQPGVLEKRRVELAFRGMEESYVKSGLKGGEHVVTTGALLLNSELGGN